MKQPNPPVGTPPTLEWVAVERLAVDPSYQRSIDDAPSRTLIGAIAKNFDWRLCLPLSCARRADGAIMVVDGQHRLEGARKRGDIPHLPCVIVSSDGVAAEAELFASLNRKRKPLKSFETWRAMLAAGDKKAVQAAALIEGSGLILAPHSNHTSWGGRYFGSLAGVSAQSSCGISGAMSNWITAARKRLAAEAE
jgi:hypothetical protein